MKEIWSVHWIVKEYLFTSFDLKESGMMYVCEDVCILHFKAFALINSNFHSIFRKIWKARKLFLFHLPPRKQKTFSSHSIKRPLIYRSAREKIFITAYIFIFITIIFFHTPIKQEMDRVEFHFRIFWLAIFLIGSVMRLRHIPMSCCVHDLRIWTLRRA